jgi:hypothetical protein
MSDSQPDLFQHLAEFKERGFTVFSNVYDQETMQQWIQKHGELQRNTFSDPQRPPWWFKDTCELAPRLMLPAVANPLILDFAELVLGPFVQLDNLTLAGFPSVAPEQVQGKVSGWHRDRWSQIPRSSAYERPLAINAITYLQDLTDAFGPLRVIPGSHRKPITLTPEEQRLPHPDEQLIHMKAGDVVVIHNGLLHSGTPNTSGQVRYFFSVYYNLTWLKHTDNHSGPNVEQILRKARERNDHRLLRLFGVDEHLEARANSGFLQPDEARWAEWAAADRAAVKPEASSS